MRIITAALGLLVLLSSVQSAVSQESPARAPSAPGDEWTHWSQDMKLGYAYGWVDGERSAILRECYNSYTTSDHYAYVRAKQEMSALARECRGTMPAFAQFNPCVDTKVNAIKAQLAQQHKLLRLKFQSCENETGASLGIPVNYTMGQFVDGIDHFYADYRNRMIPTPSIAEEVEKQLNGATETEIEADLEIDRKTTQSLH